MSSVADNSTGTREPANESDLLPPSRTAARSSIAVTAEVAPSPVALPPPLARVGALSGPAGRRLAFSVLVLATVVLLAGSLARILAGDGFSLIDALLVAALAIESLWTAHNAWNSIIGWVVSRISRDPTALVFPSALRAHADDAIFARTAVLMTLRNEDCGRALSRLRAVKASIDATGHGDKFDYFVLSDSSLPEVIAAEELAIAAWRAKLSNPGQVFYRRRAANVGFKAGNIYDFCERWGTNYDFMLPLDADSLMDGQAILRLVRILQVNPRIGILQSLIGGTPSASLFERLLHFGPRHNARLCILGGSWWQSESGPFWGHNALIRVALFTQHCRLPILRGDPPLGGHVLSHDQVEAALMRRGDYEVRVVPEELCSYEDNPPTLPDFIRRHLRWCQGNLQYLKLRHEPGLLTLSFSRFYLWLALELFFSMAGMVVFAVLAAIAAARWPAHVPFPAGEALALYLAWMALYFMPRIVGTLDALVFSAKRYGGRLRLLAGSALESAFTLMLTPIANVTASVFMLGLLFGRKVGWDVQRRDGYGLSWASATKGFWPQTAFGCALALYLVDTAPGAIPWFAPFLAGLIAAIPLAVVTSSPLLGALAAHWKLFGLPEEFDTPPEIAAITPPTAHAARQRGGRPRRTRREMRLSRY
jgi:membrane glycosyltransferase